MSKSNRVSYSIISRVKSSVQMRIDGEQKNDMRIHGLLLRVMTGPRTTRAGPLVMPISAPFPVIASERQHQRQCQRKGKCVKRQR